jgi:hypothetical protein
MLEWHVLLKETSIWVVKVKRDLENQIRGVLKNLGLVIGKVGGNVFRRHAMGYKRARSIGPAGSPNTAMAWSGHTSSRPLACCLYQRVIMLPFSDILPRICGD